MSKSIVRIENGVLSFRKGNLDEIGAFVGSTSPTRTLVEGDCWINTTTALAFKLQLRDNASTWINQTQ
jgi:hypothetical protein